MKGQKTSCAIIYHYPHRHIITFKKCEENEETPQEYTSMPIKHGRK